MFNDPERRLFLITYFIKAYKISWACWAFIGIRWANIKLRAFNSLYE